jgi:transposase
MNQITTVGVDLAKEVIVVCAGDAQGRTVYFKQFSFAGFAEWSVKLAPCAFGMEAVQLRTSLGAILRCARAYRKADGRGIRGTLPQKPRGEERSQ